MIKRIIFDLDNTLIEWKDEYWFSLNRALDKYGIQYSKEDVLNLKKAVDNFEIEYNMYKKEYMLECMNEYSNLKLNIKFIDLWIEELSKCIPTKLEKEIVETLEYLYKKYELVVLTNWYKISQKRRMDYIGISRFFKEIYAPEEFLNKPSEESFLIASNGKPNECIMVGDSLKTDIEGALNVGMKAIYINKKAKENKNYKVIKRIEELKDIL